MIVSQKFVFLHLHKSGGSFVNRMMLSCIPYAKQIGYHLPYSMLPSGYKRLPVIGTVRNPWAYYVSWYFFQSQLSAPNALFRLVSNNNSLGFEDTIRNLLSLNKNNEFIEILQQQLPDTFQLNGINLTKSCLSQFKQDNIGFYSFLYNRLYAGAHQPNIIKTELLRAGLTEALQQLNVDTLPKLQAYLRDMPDVNTSEHLPYRQYYSDTLRCIVAGQDAKLIEQYQYEF
jgi:hypothetical protein